MQIRAGDTISLTTIVKLPSGDWEAAVIAKTNDSESFNFDAELSAVDYSDHGVATNFCVELSRVGPNADTAEIELSERLLVVSAPASRTATWNTIGGKTKSALALVRFTDSSPEPVVITTKSFEINILGQP